MYTMYTIQCTQNLEQNTTLETHIYTIQCTQNLEQENTTLETHIQNVIFPGLTPYYNATV